MLVGFILGYGIYGFPLPKIMKRGIIIFMFITATYDLIFFDYTLINFGNTESLVLTNYISTLMFVVLFGMLMFREFNKKMNDALTPQQSNRSVKG